MPSRCCIQCVSKSARPRSGHRTGKDQPSPQFPRRAVPNIGDLHSSPTLVRSCLKSCMLGFSLTWTKNFQAGFRKGRGTRAQIANIHWIIEKAREFQKNIYLCFIDCTKAFDCVDHIQKKITAMANVQKLFPTFSSRSFIILHLTFRAVWVKMV